MNRFMWILLAALSFSPSKADPVCSPALPVDTHCTILILSLKPTQFAVGMREVERKQAEIAAMTVAERDRLMRRKPAPLAVAPNGDFFVIDHHHLALALHLNRIASMSAVIRGNFSGSAALEFWPTMIRSQWTYLYDENGQGPLEPTRLPADVRGLRDDPYRSLSSDVQRAGGYRKTHVPFQQFEWASFFRARSLIAGPSDAQYAAAVQDGLRLAHSAAAQDLSGYLPN